MSEHALPWASTADSLSGPVEATDDAATATDFLPEASAGLAGLLFGLGLGISGMTMPSKVIGFLDLADGWDPSLAFVMIGAIAVHLVSYRLILKRDSPLLGARFGIPTRSDIDLRLVGGSALFGVGWALGGYCPGPGLVSAGSGLVEGVVFTAALTAGMLLFHILDEAVKGAST